MRQTLGSESEQRDFKYFAFISYSNQDKKWCDWLHKDLEMYRVPKRMVGSTGRFGKVPARLFPIFRDREELATSSDLGGNIRTALEESRFLVVICSPNSAHSLWVNEEILYFKRLGRESRVLPLIVAGEPNASDSSGGPDVGQECFAHALRFALGADGTLSGERSDPIAADARASGDGPTNAKLKLLAGILGLDFDVLKQRERIRKRRRMAAIAAAALCLCAMGAGIWKYQDWKGRRAIEIQKQAHEAQLRANEALLTEEEGRAALLKGDTLTAAKDLMSAYKVRHEEPGLRLMLGFAMRGLEGLKLVLRGHTREIRQMDFAFTGRYLSTIASDGAARIWDMQSGRELQVLGRDGDKFNQIRCVQFSPDGAKALFVNQSESYIQEIGASGRRIDLHLPANSSKPDSALFTPDRQCVIGTTMVPDLSGGKFSTQITEWDASSGAQLSTVSIADSFAVLGVDGTGQKAVLVGGIPGVDPKRSYRKAISVDIKTGEITDAVPLDRILDLVYLNPAGNRILVCGGRGVPRVYSVETGQLVFELNAPGRVPYGNGRWSPSGKWIITSDRDASETIWDSTSGKPVRTWPNIGSTAAAMDPQDTVLATEDNLGRVELRDVNTGGLLRVIEDRIGWLETKAYLFDNSLRFSPDGKYLALAGGGPTVKIWDWRKTSSPLLTLSGHAKPINSITFSLDDKKVVTGSEDDTAKVWDTGTGRALLDLHGDAESPASDVFGPMFSANGKYILAGAAFGEAKLWDAFDGRLVKNLTFDKKGIVFGDRIRTAASLRGNRFITVSSNGTGALWDFKTLDRIGSFTAQPSNSRTGVEKVEFSKDGRECLIAIGDGKVFIFDSAAGNLKTSFGSLENGLTIAEWNPAGGQVLIADKLGRITIWDVNGGKPVGVLDGSRGVVANDVHFSPDGTWIVAACSDHAVRVWPSRGGPVRTLAEQKLPAEDRLSPTLGAPIGLGETRSGFITSRFSPDGHFIAGGTEIGKICIWEAMSGRQLLRFDVRSGRVTALCFNFDGSRLAAATENSLAFVWNLSLEGRVQADLEHTIKLK